MRIHVLHQRTQMRVGLYDKWCLGGIDECCGEFPGLVNSELRTRGEIRLGRLLTESKPRKEEFHQEEKRTALSRNCCCSWESGA